MRPLFGSRSRRALPTTVPPAWAACLLSGKLPLVVVDGAADLLVLKKGDPGFRIWVGFVHGFLMTSQVMRSKSVVSLAWSCWLGITKSRPAWRPAATRFWKVLAISPLPQLSVRADALASVTCAGQPHLPIPIVGAHAAARLPHRPRRRGQGCRRRAGYPQPTKATDLSAAPPGPIRRL